MSQAETELKLLLPGADASTIQAQLRRLPLLRRRQTAEQWLSNVYHDTPEHRLRQERHALRMRRIGNSPPDDDKGNRETGSTWVQTFKSAGTSQGGLSQRGEWESVEPAGQLNERALAHTPWRSLDPDGKLFKTLQPCFETRCHRTTWQLHRYEGAHIEVALDIGDIRAGTRAAPILELELELKEGPPEALFHLAQAIAKTIAVLPCDASKAQRGYQLAEEDTASASRAQAIRWQPDIDPTAATSQALGEIFEHFTRNLAALTTSDEPEVVHQARVAWRRWITALRLLSPWIGVRPDTSGLKPLLKAMGHMRDLDVLRHDTLARWLPLFVGGDARRAILAETTLRNIDAARATQRVRTLLALATPATGRALLAMAHNLSTPPGAPAPESPAPIGKPDKPSRKRRQTKAHPRWAAERLAALDRRLRKAIRSSRSPGAGKNELHRVRLRAKQVRYAAELMGELVPQKIHKATLKESINLQRKIGDARDLEQAVLLLGALALDATLIAFLRGVLAERNHTG